MRVGLFLGVETQNWTLDMFVTVAQQVKAVGVDALFIKVADGGNAWYGAGFTRLADGETVWSDGNLINILTAIGKIVHVIPYQYCYGGRFGALSQEVAICNQLLVRGYDLCLDMEIEYNNHPEWCVYLQNNLKGKVSVSTWADPAQQQWNTNLKVLDSITTTFYPQVYTPYLQNVWVQQWKDAGINIDKCIPTVTPDTTIVGAGREEVTLWEYLNFSKPALQEVVSLLAPEVSMTQTNPHQVKQAVDVWAANTVGAPSGTGIFHAWLDHYVPYGEDYGVPITKEIDTVDWSGAPIKKQFFSQGVSIEWNSATGEHHAFDLHGEMW